MIQTFSHHLATFYMGLSAAALPLPTRHAVRRHVLDTLGVGMAGSGQPEPQSVLGACASLCGEGGPAVVWGSGQGVPAFPAALINGTAAHALELDDASGCDHSGAVIVPAVMAALAKAPHATDNDVMAAVAAGYDVARRVMEAAGGYDAHNNAGWHSTGTCGVFGACIAVARLWRLDGAVATHALGIAGSFASGNWSFMGNGAMTKRLHPGHAAAAGLMAVELARQGMTGPDSVFEADWGGFFKTYTHPATTDAGLLVADLGELWRIHRSSIKPFASCRGTHSAVEIAQKLRDAHPASDIKKLRVSVTQTIARMCGATSIHSLVDAQMSLPYAVAVAWLTGQADLACFQPPLRGSAEVTAFMDRVELVVSPDISSNLAARIDVETYSGKSAHACLDVPSGSWNNPLSDAALIAKFRSLATPVVGDVAATRLLERVWALEGEGLATDIPSLTAKCDNV
ncbi:MAG: MmgE/PrpD family protein [Acetobacter sp.]